MDQQDILKVAEQLRSGAVIAYPSESVFGLGCLPDRPKAVKRLLSIKKRSSEKGLILVAGSLAQLLTWIEPLDADGMQTVQTPRDRATTWVVPTRSTTPDLLTGGRDTIAIRISRHPLIQALCQACNSALISTSANLSGEAPVTSVNDLDRRVRDKVDLVLHEDCLGENAPSQIIDLHSGQILRD